MTSRSKSRSGSLDTLIDSAPIEVLRELARSVAAKHPTLRPMCLDILSRHLPSGDAAKAAAAAASARALWSEAAAIIDDFSTFGGGPEEDEAALMDLLSDLSKRVPDLPRADRRGLLDACLACIARGNSGLEDSLYEFAYACCPDDADLRHLAGRLEATGDDWPNHHAREIYRRLGDRENYLRLRLREMRYGLDYYDLATYYLENGERDKAVQTARDGIAQAEGRMDELRSFYAKELRRTGDRGAALELEFENMLERLSPKTYTSFRAQCSNDEWQRFEPRFLASLPSRRTATRIDIHMARGEHEAAVRLLASVRFDTSMSESVLQAASTLEAGFPGEVLSFYRSGLGRTDQSAPRWEYAQWANIIAKMRHLWVDVLGTPDAWAAFARELQAQSQRRPAMREEFRKVLGDWDTV